MNTMVKKTLLERLAEGPVIGDGSYMYSLERRGYAMAGPWIPDAVVEHPSAVLGLHREFLRAGSDVIQAVTFYSTDDRLVGRSKISAADINREAAALAKEVAAEGDALTLGGMSQCASYLDGAGKEMVQEEFRKQVKAG